MYSLYCTAILCRLNKLMYIRNIVNINKCVIIINDRLIELGEMHIVY